MHLVIGVSLGFCSSGVCQACLETVPHGGDAPSADCRSDTTCSQEERQPQDYEGRQGNTSVKTEIEEVQGW